MSTKDDLDMVMRMAKVSELLATQNRELKGIVMSKDAQIAMLRGALVGILECSEFNSSQYAKQALVELDKMKGV